MTVAELIAELQKFPPDMRAYVDGGEDEEWMEIETVRRSESDEHLDFPQFVIVDSEEPVGFVKPIPGPVKSCAEIMRDAMEQRSKGE